MSLLKIIQNLDVTKIKSTSGLTFSQELVNAANLLKECIQNRINRETMGNCISAADLADIKANKNSLSITLRIQNHTRPSIFNEWNHKFANVFWLLNDGFTVKKDWYFNGFSHKERWVYREAEYFVEKGIEDFNNRTRLPVKIRMVKRPDIYYWEK